MVTCSYFYLKYFCEERRIDDQVLYFLEKPFNRCWVDRTEEIEHDLSHDTAITTRPPYLCGVGDFNLLYPAFERGLSHNRLFIVWNVTGVSFPNRLIGACMIVVPSRAISSKCK